MQSLSSLARIVGPLWGGFAFDHLGIGMPYISGAAVMAIASALSIHALWRTRISSGP
jgi:predicted MFS family arabinose efflux permease